MPPAADPQTLSSMAWALGELGHVNEQLHGSLLQQAVQQVKLAGKSTSCSGEVGVADPSPFNTQGLCNISWSVAVLDLQQHMRQLQVLVQAAGQQQQLWDSMTDDQLCQLYHVHLWLLDCQQPGYQQGLQDILTADQLQQCKGSWQQQIARMVLTPTVEVSA